MAELYRYQYSSAMHVTAQLYHFRYSCATINHQADVATFARTLRTSLEAGVTTEHQLSCVDRGTRTMRVNGVKVPAAMVSSLR